ncbi:hypothetical protein NQZ68_008025 [Dissostichus eleginoides]|nr:hypothetical protein NQZ68_008025 [Dissostichus eleginoides]
MKVTVQTNFGLVVGFGLIFLAEFSIIAVRLFHRLHEVEVKVGWRGLSWCGSGLLQQQLASWVRAADPDLFTYSPLEQEVDTHLNPPQHTWAAGPDNTQDRRPALTYPLLRAPGTPDNKLRDHSDL